MTTPAMDSTGVTGESSGSAETSPPPSAPSKINKPNSKSQRLSALPPYFRSYEAYIEHCVAQVGREEIPETAFDRLCASCTAVFKNTAELIAVGKNDVTLPICTVNEFLRSAAEGICHVCHWLMADILRERGNTPTDFDRESPESGVDWLEREDAAITLYRSWNFLKITVWQGDGTERILARFYIDGKCESYSRDRGLLTALTTASEASWNQALKWIENCRSHPLCNPVQTANAQAKWPARLVAVGSVGDAQVRVCETSRLGFVERSYMTLSHCWGKNGVPTQLMEENYARFLNGIQFGELPKTFRDAIDVTRKLKIPFIWIDSLCIIQNSYDDWIQESAKMQQVYQNSFLNLAAGASADSNAGLFYRRYPLSVVPWSIRLGANEYLTPKYISEHRNDGYAQLILNTRGWVLQEQLLARRTLVFGQKELHWECSTCQASETFSDPNNRPTSHWFDLIFRRDWQSLLRGKLVDSKRQEAWNRLTRTYFERSLTHASDRLVAISGLAEQLSSRWSGITYLAGLWSYRLISGLLWCCLNPCSQRNTEIAPSWSWASLIQPCRSGQPSGLMTRSREAVDVLAEILEASVIPQNRTNPFGPIAFGGSVKVRSPVLRARITAVSDRYREYILGHGDDCNLATLELRNILVDWDEVNDVKADIRDAYLVPFQIQVEREPGWVLLIGLILLATAVHSDKTQFRRAGYFKVCSNFFDEDSDDESDNGSDVGYDGSSQDWIDSNTEDAALEDSYISSDEEDHLGYKLAPQELKQKGLLRDIDSWFAKKVRDGLEERMDYLKKDPYVNGPPLNTTLENRYLTKSGWDLLPDYSRFLEAIARVAKHNKANGTPDPVLGYGEGNGYYTFEIV